MRFIVEVDEPAGGDYLDYANHWQTTLASLGGVQSVTRVKGDPPTRMHDQPAHAADLTKDLRVYESQRDVREVTSEDFKGPIDVDDEAWVHRNYVDQTGTDKPFNLVSSVRLREGHVLFGRDTMHMPLFDVDMPVYVIPSKTPGHFHLGFPSLSWTIETYLRFLQCMVDFGIVQEGYLAASQVRKASFIRAYPTPTGFKNDEPPEGWPQRVPEDHEKQIVAGEDPF